MSSDITIDGLPAVVAGLDKLTDRLRTQAIAEAIGGVVVANIRLGFSAGESPYGEKWAAPRWREGQPLVHTGRLRDSIDYQVEGDTVIIGSNVKYAKIHQFGGVIKPKNGKALHFEWWGNEVFVESVTMPARPYLPLDGLPADWQGDVADAVEQVLNQSAM